MPDGDIAAPPADPTRRWPSFVDLLALEPDGVDRFVAPSPGDGPGRLYGGQVAAQALRAATLTVDHRQPHSLHAYFVRPGKPGVPLALHAERTRDGRSFATRTITARQDGDAIFVMIASFHTGEDGDDWQPDAAAVVAVTPPEELATRPVPWQWRDGFDVRPINPVEDFRIHPCWVRMTDPIVDDPAWHACGLTFISDRAVVGSARAPGSRRRVQAASLDHAVWFHRPARIDEWLLFSVTPESNAAGRGLATGTFHTREGRLVASIAQEALLRPVRP